MRFAAVFLLLVPHGNGYADDNVADDNVVPKQEFSRERHNAALAHFQKRCKGSAGEKIYRSVKDVESIFLQYPQQRPTEFQLREQYWMGDPYDLVLYPPAEISAYLRALDVNDIPTTRRTARPGFKFVEAPNPGNAGFLVHRLDSDRDGILTAVSDKRLSRYAVVRRDISTAEDRLHWVAGGKLSIVDLSTNELLGERVGYVWEAGLGSTSGARRPWLFAQRNACPPIRRNAAMDRLFVEKVLVPPASIGDGR